MKFLGYIIQLLCIIALLKGVYSDEYQLLVYIICLGGGVNLIYNIVSDYIKRESK